MRKLAISIAITSVLGLSACDDTTLEDIQQESAELQQEIADIAAESAMPRVRVVWDPSNSEISVPNDLLFSGTIDGTLEMPDETSAKDDGEAVDFGNPSAALGALDGWGIQNSFSIALEYEDSSLTIDATTITSSDAVAIYQVEKFPSQTDTDCSNTDYSGLICKGIEQLTYGVDYITSMSDGDLVIVLAKPLKAGASYAVALTNEIKDSNGDDLMPSSTYASVEQDIETTPLVLPSLTDDELNETQAGIRLLQTLTNNFEDSLVSAFGADKDEIIYTQVFTTESAGVAGTDPLQIVKLLNAQTYAATVQTDPTVSLQIENVSTGGYTVADVLLSYGLIENPSYSYSLLSTAYLYSSSIEVPYYLETDETGDPLSGRWEAACDSGAILSSATTEQLAAGTAGDNNATCAALGLADLGLDTQRHLTKYNPLPETKSTETLEVQVTLPNITAAAALGTTLVKPEDGWPVVILQHGITSKKEDMLAVTGTLAMAGFATVAIDHPLHASRGFEFDVEDEDGEITTTYINASDGYEDSAATAYLNLSSLLTARDNLRQSVADTLKLRLALNSVVDVSDSANPVYNIIDASKVHYVGHSLGAITGTNFTAIANTPVSTGDETTNAAINALYAIQSSVLANPGSSIANFLLESASFSPLIKASVIYSAGDDISAAVLANITDISTVIAANVTGDNPSASCQALAAGSTEESYALICAYEEFLNNATDDELATIESTLSQFAFAAQALLEAGDPSNYASLLATLQTPVLMFEVVGDGVNQSDLVIPNTVSTDPFQGIAGTTGLANQLGLAQISETTLSETAFSGIVRFNNGSHSSLLSTEVPDYLTAIDSATYTTKFAAVTSEMQTMMATFFASGNLYVPVSDTAKATCIITDYVSDTCPAAE